MKNIIIIQHAQSVQHTNGMVGSWTDWELTELGRKQAENIGRKLSAELIGQGYVVYSSDLMRAKQTAEPLARYLGVDIAFRKELREHNDGEAVGKSRQWARENVLPVNSFYEPKWRGGESWGEFWNRVSGVYWEVMEINEKNIIVVAHAGTLFVWKSIWQGFEIKEFEGSSSLVGGVSFLKITGNGKQIIEQLNNSSYREEA